MTCENCTYLPGLAEESLGGCSSATQPYAPLKSSHIANKCSERGNETESCQTSRSLVTSGNLMGDLGEEKLTSSQVDFRVRMYQQQTDKAKGSTGPDPDFGKKWPESFAKLGPDSCLWKTSQISLFGGWESFSETWPRWGIMQDGECWEIQTSAEITTGRESGFLPTASAKDGPGHYVATIRCAEKRIADQKQTHWIHHALLFYNSSKAWANARFSEWMMNFPDRWTDLKPLETDKFQQWQQQHSAFSAKD